MAAISTILAGIGIAVGLAGTAVSVSGSMAAADASKKAEKLREQQMKLESDRARRAAIRQSLQARAVALTNATAQGAEGGSGLQGGYGQIGGQTGTNIVGINQAQEIGAGIFAANVDAAGAQSLISIGSGLGSLGGSIIDNAPTLGKITTYATGGAVR